MKQNIIQIFPIKISENPVSTYSQTQTIYLVEAILKMIKYECADYLTSDCTIEFSDDIFNGYNTIICKGMSTTFSSVLYKLESVSNEIHFIESTDGGKSWSSDIATKIISDGEDIFIWGTDDENLKNNLLHFYQGNETVARSISNDLNDNTQELINKINNIQNQALQYHTCSDSAISNWNDLPIINWRVSVMYIPQQPGNIGIQTSVSEMNHIEIPELMGKNIPGTLYSTTYPEVVQFVDFRDFDFSKHSDCKIIFFGPTTMIGDAWKNYGRRKFKQPLLVFAGLYNVRRFIFKKGTLCSLRDMGGMFNSLRELRVIDVSHFDTSECRNMAGMFLDCSKLTALDLQSMKVNNCENMEAMFGRCRDLEVINFEGWEVDKCKNMHLMFHECESLKSLVLPFIASNCEDMSEMFMNCKQLKTIDISHFDTSNCKNMSKMFMGCSSLEHIDLSNFDFTRCENMNNMFSGCSSIKSIDLSNRISACTEIEYLFACCNNLTDVNLHNFKMPNCENITGLFAKCTNMRHIDLSSVDVPNCKKASYLFSYCSSLQSIDISRLELSQCKDITGMFEGCELLETVDLNGLDLSRCEYIGSMFQDCKSLKTIDFSRLDLSNCKNFMLTFSGCESLQSLDLSNCNINCEYFSSTFCGCKSLRLLNLSNCNIEGPGFSTFEDCNSLETIIMKNCNNETINIIKQQLEEANLNTVTIVS